MKGKKFNAAERHFQEKEMKMRHEFGKQMAEANRRIDGLEAARHDLIKENTDLTNQLTVLEKRYEQVMKLSALTEEDVDKSVRGAEAMSTFMGMAKFMSQF